MNSKAFFFQGDTLLLPAGSRDTAAEWSDITLGVPLKLAEDFKESETFQIPALGLRGELRCKMPSSMIHVVSVMPGADIPENWKGIPFRQVFAMSGSVSSECNEVIRACHFSQWKHDSLFCGRCGAKNNDISPDASGNAHRSCPVCGRHEFPKICPAIIVIITDAQNRILLAHNKKFRTGLYSHISGFNDPGETLEETVVREIREEINIEVKDVVYVKSQPWPFPHSLMIGFKARYSSGTIRPDDDEIEDAKWFTKDSLPDLPGEGSLSRFLINCWLDDTL